MMDMHIGRGKRPFNDGGELFGKGSGKWPIYLTYGPEPELDEIPKLPIGGHKIDHNLTSHTVDNGWKALMEAMLEDEIKEQKENKKC